MHHYYLVCLGLMCLILSVSSRAQPNTHNLAISTDESTIIDTATNTPIDYPAFLMKLAWADYVILGEYHDSISQHRLAGQLLKDLHKQRPQGSLLLEMLTVDQQANIDKLTQKSALPHTKKLAKALNWQTSWDWSLYEQIVTQPFEFGYALVGTNLTKNEIQILMQGAEPLNGHLSTSDDIKTTLKQRILTAHSFDKNPPNKTDEAVVDNMVAIQQFRDRRMAEKILASPKPALLLTGNYHAQKHIGIPMHLIDLTHRQVKPTGVVVLMSKTANEFKAEDADFIWIIPEN